MNDSCGCVMMDRSSIANEDLSGMLIFLPLRTLPSLRDFFQGKLSALMSHAEFAETAEAEFTFLI